MLHEPAHFFPFLHRTPAYALGPRRRRIPQCGQTMAPVPLTRTVASHVYVPNVNVLRSARVPKVNWTSVTKRRRYIQRSQEECQVVCGCICEEGRTSTSGLRGS